MRAVFGVTDAQRRERLRVLLRGLLDAGSSAQLQFQVLLARRFGRRGPLTMLHELGVEIDELLLAEIAERRADPAAAERDDILTLLLAARFEDGSAMSDRELRDQLMTLLVAGHETTATGLAWTFDLLLHHSAVRNRLKDELAGGGEEYLDAVVKESLRVRPVVPGIGRVVRGGPARRPPAGVRAPRRRARSSRRDGCDAGDLADAHARGPVPGAVRVQAGALPGAAADDLRLDPLRWRHPPVPRRGVRGDGDADRPRRDRAAP